MVISTNTIHLIQVSEYRIFIKHLVGFVKHKFLKF